MKNKYLLFMLFIISLFIFNMDICLAASYRGKIIGTGVRLRNGPGTNYDSLKSVSKDSEYMLVNNNIYESESGCASGWYKVYFDGSSTGYVCKDYIEVTEIVFNETPTNECEQALSDLGFPPTYWPGLCSLKEAYPMWQFKPILTGLDFSDAVDNESACGLSYIASSIPTNIDSTCKNQYTKTWYPASSTAVAYYMDPRNWLTEKYIFQFEYLKYDESISLMYQDAIKSAIDHANFYKYHLGIGNNLAEIIDSVGKETNVSPIFIASRILQEMGSKDSLYNLFSGVYDGENGKYVGYYNFYNFGVTDTCATTKGTTLCGLSYAFSKNWYGLKPAIKGGAEQIAKSYITKGQYSTYLQKFNVAPLNASSLYTHQYMTNVGGPSSEAKTTYNTYKELGLLNNTFVFYIPVYENMNDLIFSENNGAVESPDEEVKTSLDVATIITSSGYKLVNENITGISADTKVSEIKSAIESISGSNSVKISNKDNVLVTEGLIGTGFKVTISNSTESKTLTVIIKGDTSGDGLINALDLLHIQKSILGTYTLSSIYSSAADTSGDGKVNAVDLLQVQKSILGTYSIKQ